MSECPLREDLGEDRPDKRLFRYRCPVCKAGELTSWCTDSSSEHHEMCYRYQRACREAAEGAVRLLMERLRNADELAEAGKAKCVYCCAIWTHTTLALADDGAYAALGLPEKASTDADQETAT